MGDSLGKQNRDGCGSFPASFSSQQVFVQVYGVLPEAKGTRCPAGVQTFIFQFPSAKRRGWGEKGGVRSSPWGKFVHPGKSRDVPGIAPAFFWG